jgi:hypothetical protein
MRVKCKCSAYIYLPGKNGRDSSIHDPKFLDVLKNVHFLKTVFFLKILSYGLIGVYPAAYDVKFCMKEPQILFWMNNCEHSEGANFFIFYHAELNQVESVM